MIASPGATEERPRPARGNRRNRTRERLIDAAFDVFAEHGIAAASIDQIAEAAGFTKGAFYSNFESKEELFLLVTERYYQEVIESVQLRSERDNISATAAKELNADTLGALILELVRSVHSERAQQLVQLEATQLALRDSALREQYVAVRHAAHDQLGTILKHGVERMGRRLLLDAGLAIKVLLAAYDGIVTDLLLDDVPERDLGERLHEPLAVVLLGISEPVKGRDN